MLKCAFVPFHNNEFTDYKIKSLHFRLVSPISWTLHRFIFINYNAFSVIKWKGLRAQHQLKNAKHWVQTLNLFFATPWLRSTLTRIEQFCCSWANKPLKNIMIHLANFHYVHFENNFLIQKMQAIFVGSHWKKYLKIGFDLIIQEKTEKKIMKMRFSVSFIHVHKVGQKRLLSPNLFFLTYCCF